MSWMTVLRKEVVENARDRRAVLSALLYGPLIGPVLFAVILSFVIGKQAEEFEKTLELPVVGAEHAPSLIAWLQAEGVTIEPAPADPAGAVRAQEEDVVLRIPAEFPQQWAAGEPALLELLQDSSRQRTQIAVRRVETLLGRYGGTMGMLRLQARGIAPGVASPILVSREDLSTRQARAALIMAMLPYFLILSAFVGGMYLAIDTTAGERERQSLEPLLITPLSRASILTGKMLATAAYAAASLLICVLAFAVSLRFVPTAELGFDLGLSARVVALICAVILPVALVASAAQTLVASFSKSFREAQTYIQFLILIPAIPSIVMMINPMKPEAWMMATPLLSQSVLINMLARGDEVVGGDIVVSVVTTVVLAVLLAAVAIRLYQREQAAFAT